MTDESTPEVAEAVEMVQEQVQVNLRTLQAEIELLAKTMKVSEAAATQAMGYSMKKLNKILTAKETYEYIQLLTTTKTPADLDNEERLMCVVLGLIKRTKPFKATASKIGRNAPCPCNSGAKYKNCCLELAKAHDYERFYFGG